MQMNDLIPELHRPFAEYISLLPTTGGPPESLRKLAWMPRGHFKSSLTSIAYPLWLLIRDRNNTCAIISSKEDHVKKWLLEIRNTIEYNLMFQWAFPEIRKGGKWDETQVTVERDREFGTNISASVTAYTMSGGLASQHNPNIILDDPLNEHTAFSESEREKAIYLYDHLESIGSKYHSTALTVVGTPWPGYDVIQHAMEKEVAFGTRLYWGVGARGNFDMSPSLRISHPHLVPPLAERVSRDGVIFSEVCPVEKLASIGRRDLNSLTYQYLCTRPEEEDNGFRVDLIRDFSLTLDGTISCDCHPTHTHELKRLVLIAICDPALTEDKRGCESAIMVLGRDPACGCRFVLEENGWHIHPDELVKMQCQVARAWGAYLKRFAIEDQHFQSTFKFWLRELQAQGDFPLGIELFGVKPAKRDKDLRISGQQTYVANGMWHKRPTMLIDPNKKNWLWQVSKWPNQPKARDRVDAWAYCDDVWGDLASPRLYDTAAAPHPLRMKNRLLAQRGLKRIKDSQIST
jgi:hypothetical protein